MLNNASGYKKIYIACGYTDLRQGIDGLAATIRQTLEIDPFQKNVLFMFCGRKPDKIKCLEWEGDGFVLVYKRLLDGRYQWPRTRDEVMDMTQEQFDWLMSGLEIEQPKFRYCTKKEEKLKQIPSCGCFAHLRRYFV